MALYSDYCSASELKAWLGISDTDDDTKIAIVVTAVSRAIDRFCNRQFGQITTAETRYFTAENSNECKIFDLYTVTDLVVKIDADNDATYETTLTIGTDFRLTPRNASLDGKPWTGMEIITGTTSDYFPCYEGAVEVAARFGWSAVPSAVKQAALIQSDITFKRKEMGPDASDYAATSRYLDRDVQLLLMPYRRLYGAVV